MHICSDDNITIKITLGHDSLFNITRAEFIVSGSEEAFKKVGLFRKGSNSSDIVGDLKSYYNILESRMVPRPDIFDLMERR